MTTMPRGIPIPVTEIGVPSSDKIGVSMVTSRLSGLWNGTTPSVIGPGAAPLARGRTEPLPTNATSPFSARLFRKAVCSSTVLRCFHTSCLSWLLQRSAFSMICGRWVIRSSWPLVPLILRPLAGRVMENLISKHGSPPFSSPSDSRPRRTQLERSRICCLGLYMEKSPPFGP